jgi:adenylylsulfate kinase
MIAPHYLGLRHIFMSDKKSTNVTWHDGEITTSDRSTLLGQKGVTIWFTGLSGSGKSTIAVALESSLMNKKKLSYRLDGDNIRLGINKNLGFSAEDRSENIRRIGEITKLFADAGIITLASFISPYLEDRQNVRDLHRDGRIPFIEVFVDCELASAETRDPNGLYKKARAGEIKNFTGIDDPYDAPTKPEIHLISDQMSLEQEVDIILDYLDERGFLN